MTSKPFPIHRIITHAGNFHADEVMAVALLEQFYLAQPVVVVDMNPALPNAVDPSPWSDQPQHSPYDNADHERVAAWLTGTEVPPPTGLYTPDGVQDLRTPVVVVRTRRPDWLLAGQADPSVFVVDVGAQHDPSRANLDHHQKGFTETWPNGCPLSSTGLVWRWLGDHGCLDLLAAAERAEIEEHLIQPLDAHDNGVASSSIASSMAPHNRTGTAQSQDVQFRVALDMMRGVLANTMHGARARLEAERVLSEAWGNAARRGVPYVILNHPIAYTDSATLLRRISGGQAHLLALPGRGQRWSIISIPGDHGAFSVKCPCPSAWRGRFDLDATVEGRHVRVLFGHKSGFMSTVLGSRADVQATCRTIIRTAGLFLTLNHQPVAAADAPVRPTSDPVPVSAAPVSAVAIPVSPRVDPWARSRSSAHPAPPPAGPQPTAPLASRPASLGPDLKPVAAPSASAPPAVTHDRPPSRVRAPQFRRR